MSICSRICMLYTIRCNLMHPLYGALPVLYVSVKITCCALLAHWYTYAPSCCRFSKYHKTSIPFSVSMWNDLADPVFDVVGLVCYKSRADAFFIDQAAFSFFIFYCFPFLFWLIGCKLLSLSLALTVIFNTNNNNNNNNLQWTNW